jgi:deoxyribodipyrimidine photolyase-related protein
MTTKPYVSGAGYIHKMSDCCSHCPFDPKKNCPLTFMYWDFLARHRERLSNNARLKLPLASQAKRSPEKKARDRAAADHVRDALFRGEVVTPESVEGAGCGPCSGCAFSGGGGDA